MPDPSCNPYLAFAAMLRAGLDGIDNDLDPGAPVSKNIYKMSQRERRSLRIDELPQNLDAALDQLERSALMRDTLGDHIFEHFIEAKRREWFEYLQQVSAWEIAAVPEGVLTDFGLGTARTAGNARTRTAANRRTPTRLTTQGRVTRRPAGQPTKPGDCRPCTSC